MAMISSMRLFLGEVASAFGSGFIISFHCVTKFLRHSPGKVTGKAEKFSTGVGMKGSGCL
jgi:hypothetical protein